MFLGRARAIVVEAGSFRGSEENLGKTGPIFKDLPGPRRKIYGRQK